VDISVAHGLSAVDPSAWDALTLQSDPFTRHGFLALLEQSESVGPARTGWQPLHVLVHDAGELVAAMPLYLKHHSYGEFIFDFAWAQAAMRAGLPYYPKLVSSVPLTPVPGRRLLTHPGRSRLLLMQQLIAGAEAVMRETHASSLHVLFCTAEESDALGSMGLHPRKSVEYQFDNPGARSFDELLTHLRSPSRKQVRNERRKAQSYGLEFSMRPFHELPPTDVAAMWEFYLSTIDRHGSEPYLTRAFYDGLPTLAHAYAAMAHRDGVPVAGALFFQAGNALYGRYWGAREELPMLHFELCYYYPLAWALPRGIDHVEAGAQGEHKIKRGFLPQLCHSAHRAQHPGLDQAIARFVAEEALHIANVQATLNESTPFKRASDTD
jgi:predicted N-acyltransferase